MATKKEDKAEKEKKVENMGFDAKVVPQVLQGKTKTYRVRDHDLKRGDKVEFENSQTGEIFGNAMITKVEKTTVKNIDLKDPTHGTTYNNVDELIAAFKRHKPAVEVNPNTEVFVYTYKFMPSKKEVAAAPEKRPAENIAAAPAKKANKKIPAAAQRIAAAKEEPWEILKWSKLTEKAIALVEKENKLVFIVKAGATSAQIKAAIESAFDIKVEKVNTLIDTKGEKKAFIKLQKGFSALDIATRLGMM